MAKQNKNQEALELLKEILDEFIFTSKGNICEQIVTGDKYQVQGYVRQALKDKLDKAVILVRNKELDYYIKEQPENRTMITQRKINSEKKLNSISSKIDTDVKESKTKKTKKVKNTSLSKLDIVKLLRKQYKKTITRTELLQFAKENNIKSVSFIMVNYKTKKRGVYKVPSLSHFKN